MANDIYPNIVDEEKKENSYKHDPVATNNKAAGTAAL